MMFQIYVNLNSLLLKLQAGEDIHLYVTVFDGTLEAKTEVYAQILSESSQRRQHGFSNGGNPRNPSIPRPLNFPSNFQGSIINPPPSISNNPRPLPKFPYFQETTYTQPKPAIKRPDAAGNRNSNDKTYLKPIGTSSTSTVSSSVTTTTTNHPTEETKNKVELDGVELTNGIEERKGEAVQSVPEVKINIIPLLAVVGVFLVVAFTAVLFRRRLNLGKAEEKSDMVSGI